MIQNQTIVCFASSYDAPPTSKHHVMHLLAERNSVLWVNYHASRAPTASASDMRYLLGKLAQVAGGLRQVRQNVHVLTPLVVPLPGRAWARQLNRRLLIRQVGRAIAKLRNGPLQIWSFSPDVSYVLGAWGEQKVVYYCVDDHASFTGYDREQVLRDEEDLCRKADLVVTTSMALQQAKSHLCPRTILVQHGVEYDHFVKATTVQCPQPADLADIPRPRLGFFGLIRDWVDLDMLCRVADRRKDWHFVLIGDSTVDLAPYRRANMHFLGRKSYQELPAYCRHLDVGLIPFRINELTLAVNPIKLREYMAAGLPVVSSPLPEVMAYRDMIEIADSPNSFVVAVERALSEDGQARLCRIAAMAKETWPQKVELICEHLQHDARPSEQRGGVKQP